MVRITMVSFNCCSTDGEHVATSVKNYTPGALRSEQNHKQANTLYCEKICSLT